MRAFLPVVGGVVARWRCALGGRKDEPYGLLCAAARLDRRGEYGS